MTAAASIPATDDVAELPTLPPGARGFELFIPGEPSPQGSKTVGRTRTGRTYVREAVKGTKGWRDDVRLALMSMSRPIRSHWPYAKGGMTIGFEFIMPRRSSTPKRTTPPCETKPDGDKLERAVGDALTQAGVLEEDSRITHTYRAKRYAQRDEEPGLRLLVVPAHRAFEVSLRPEVLAELAASTN